MEKERAYCLTTTYLFNEEKSRESDCHLRCINVNTRKINIQYFFLIQKILHHHYMIYHIIYLYIVVCESKNSIFYWQRFEELEIGILSI